MFTPQTPFALHVAPVVHESWSLHAMPAVMGTLVHVVGLKKSQASNKQSVGPLRPYVHFMLACTS
jgi:hypothetical protein